MGEYHSYSEILNFMDRIPNFLPNQAKVRLIGQTVEGREIRGIQVINFLFFFKFIN